MHGTWKTHLKKLSTFSVHSDPFLLGIDLGYCWFSKYTNFDDSDTAPWVFSSCFPFTFSHLNWFKLPLGENLSRMACRLDWVTIVCCQLIIFYSWLYNKSHILQEARGNETFPHSKRLHLQNETSSPRNSPQAKRHHHGTSLRLTVITTELPSG